MEEARRARGRARGRARVVPQGPGDGHQQAPQQQRPGMPPQQQQRPGMPPQQQRPGPGMPPQQRPGMGMPPQQRLDPSIQKPPPQGAASGGPGGEPALTASGRGVRRGGLQPTTGGNGEGARAANREVILGSRRQYDQSMFDPRTRPEHIHTKQGAGGQPSNLMSNFFKLNCTRNWCLYQYRVDYSPEVDHKGARKGMLRDHMDVIGKVFIFDGTMLFSTRRLPDKVTECFSQRRSDGSKVRLTISLTSELAANSPISLQLYNIIFRWVLEKIGMMQVGRNYYNPSMGFTIDCQRITFEMWPGFVTSILQYERDVMLCAEVSHKLMRKDTVLDVMNQMIGDCQRRGRNFQIEVEKFLKGQIVLTRYNNNTYKIDGIEWNLNVSMTFDKRGEKVSYADYYKQQYNITVRDRQQPLLLSIPKKSEIRKRGIEVIHLVPELCTITGLTDEIRSDYQTMKQLATHTKQGPGKRAQAITSFIHKITGNQEVNERLKEWGLSFDNQLVELPARQLPPEAITFGERRVVTGGPQASWDHEFRNSKLLKCVELKKWFIVHSSRDKRIANDLSQTMNKVSRPMGFYVDRPTMIELQSDRIDAFERSIRDIVTRNRDMQMACIMLPSNLKERYDAIKTLCCVELAIPSQVVVSRTLSKPQRLMSIVTKIAIQINCKLGGEAWMVNIPLGDCMIIGIDTYHDSAKRGRSVGGFVASLNRPFTRWFSNATFQHTGEEFIDGLKICMSGALRQYREMNGNKLPGRIIIFRDGVGDGQLGFVRDFEIPQLIECFKVAQADYKPMLTVIVVTKRINSRFFKIGRSKTDLSNPPPGTIIDDVVTRPDWYDFFVVSQSVREGTVSPTHFNVIYDTSNLKPDHMQRLAYKLCHLYYNWPGTIRVPAPCLYAHKLAFLIGQSIHKPVAASLSDKLYYL